MEKEYLQHSAFKIIIPATDPDDPDDIVNAASRNLVFYDEHLHFYVEMTPKVQPEGFFKFAEEGVEIQIIVDVVNLGKARIYRGGTSFVKDQNE